MQAAAYGTKRVGERRTRGKFTTDEVSDDFGVGVAGKGDAVMNQFGMEFGMVFDDAVVNDSHPSAGVHMRVRVAIIRSAVSSPAGVPDSDRALQSARAEFFVQILDPSGLLRDLQQPGR